MVIMLVEVVPRPPLLTPVLEVTSTSPVRFVLLFLETHNTYIFILKDGKNSYLFIYTNYIKKGNKDAHFKNLGI